MFEIKALETSFFEDQYQIIDQLEENSNLSQIGDYTLIRTHFQKFAYFINLSILIIRIA